MQKTRIDHSELEKRVEMFKARMLPGQPMGIHLGTARLIADLWVEVQRLDALMRDRGEITGDRSIREPRPLALEWRATVETSYGLTCIGSRPPLCYAIVRFAPTHGLWGWLLFKGPEPVTPSVEDKAADEGFAHDKESAMRAVEAAAGLHFHER